MEGTAVAWVMATLYSDTPAVTIDSIWGVDAESAQT